MSEQEKRNLSAMLTSHTPHSKQRYYNDFVKKMLAVAVVTTQLAGCGVASPKGETAEVQQEPPAVVEAAPQTVAASTVEEKPEAVQQELIAEQEPPAVELQEATGDVLHKIFEEVYNEYNNESIGYFEATEEQLAIEIAGVINRLTLGDFMIPENLSENYSEWRTGYTAPQAAEVANVDPFTPVNEVVYATGAVNVRSGPSTKDAKITQLKWGESVTRIGVGTGDVANWSRVQMEDGSEVYVSSKYLSTTKPVEQQTPTQQQPSSIWDDPRVVCTGPLPGSDEYYAEGNCTSGDPELDAWNQWCFEQGWCSEIEMKVANRFQRRISKPLTPEQWQEIFDEHDRLGIGLAC